LKIAFAGAGTPMSQNGFASAAALIGVAGPELWAVLAVETSGFGYLADRRPDILFERHIFSRLTGSQFDVDDPDVSQPSPGGYGPGGAHQYERLAAAMQLDDVAALQSASWGLGQVMGENFANAGYRAVTDMVTAMVAGEDNQLQAMASFIVKSNMDASLVSHDWSGFARRYNGPNYVANNYDGQLRHFYQIYSASAPDLRVRAVQAYLTYLGFAPGGVDGIAGAHTTGAVKAFQASKRLVQTGVIDAGLLAALGG
jgi:hypothetical protein